MSDRSPHLLGVALLVLLLLAPAPAVRAEERPVVWCLGDSVAWQLCWGLEQVGYGDAWDIVNHGQGTEMTFEGIPKLIDLLLTTPKLPDLVIVQYGSGDVLAGTLGGAPDFTPDDIYRRMNTIQSILQYFGIGMVWTTTPVRFRGPFGASWIDAYFEDHYRLNRLIRRISIRTPGAEFRDFAHPKGSWVKERIAPKVGRRVRQMLRRRGFSREAAGYPSPSGALE